MMSGNILQSSYRQVSSLDGQFGNAPVDVFQVKHDREKKARQVQLNLLVKWMFT